MTFGNLNNLNNIGGLGIGGVVSSFSPLSIAGLKIWVKADVGTFQDEAMTIPAIANNAGIKGWQDQSGNGNHLKTSSGGVLPNLKTSSLNSKSTIEFTGTYLSATPFTLNQPTTVYMAYKYLTFADGNIAYDGNTLDSMDLYQHATSPNVTMYAGSNGPTLTIADIDIGTYFVGTFIWNGASSLAQAGNTNAPGGRTGNPGAGNAGGFTLTAVGGGTTQNASIQVAEILVYNTAHDTTQRTNVKNYLSSRWAITL